MLIKLSEPQFSHKSSMTTGKTPDRGLKICCGITTIFLVIVVIVLTTLPLTHLKPKDPEINAKPVGLENIQFSLFPNVTLNVTLSLENIHFSPFPNVTLNVTLGMLITIENRNYGSFKYKNSMAYFHYRNSVVAEVPIEGELVPARGKINMTTSVDLKGETLISNPNFMADVTRGSLNMTSTASLHGKVSLHKIVKFPATACSTCDLSVFILTKSIDSKCTSKIKL